ncbi:DUF2239 family protein [Novosphingobium mangrovi (ex Huang et al. 2023)]|uniref:DUF2239 family protein n=1 Tax=Novosphingobium mangrovi (ex Huang et al. 2023) TaxID=2976432 RepID=A0ABT2I8J4_9SPHN|nr:DUF2239 family protein [Novosphingobium mangrovi (ex Huang et al. 2023)]MCT2401126.1 DUF2239 family protein [Novosphingobium mangrovi (ex Huang et al. 2023)]
MTDLCTAFLDGKRIARGTRRELVATLRGHQAGVLVFDDETGKVVDLDWRESEAPAAAPARKRGRPKLGVTAREVTLLPRHWDWLNRQPGGASQALRRLVDAARKAEDGRASRRVAQERAYRFMSAMAGDFPGFEQASRLLFADDPEGLAQTIAPWPADVREYVMALLHSSEGDTP